MLSPDHREKLGRELRALDGDLVEDPAHREFLAAYEIARRRQLLEPSAADDHPPPASKAVEEAVAITRKSFPDFQPDIPMNIDGLDRPEDASTRATDQNPLIEQMLALLHDADNADATDVKWELIPEQDKEQIRQDYARRQEAGTSLVNLTADFKRRVEALHAAREEDQSGHRRAAGA